MSRWIEQFKSHEYRRAWERLKNQLEQAFIDDPSVTTYVVELARLSKVVEYIDEILDSIDPDLVPLVTWDNFQSQASACADQISAYNSSRNIGHIQNANSNADNLLTYVRPYMIVAGRAGKALQRAAIGYSQVFEDRSKSVGQAVSELMRDAKASADRIASLESKFTKAFDLIEASRLELIGENGSEGTLAELMKDIADFQRQYAESKTYYADFFVGMSGQESQRVTLDNAVANASSQSKKAQEIVLAAEISASKIVEFERKILGSSDGSDEESLSYLLEQQKIRLEEFEVDQAKKTSALNEKIESLLPGATSAGLATAYLEMKNSFDGPIRSASKIFYWTIGVLILGSILLCIDKVYWFGIDFMKISDWHSFLGSFAYKLPFYGSAIWLAYYASKRRSEFQRLQQEYAHKEALAKSYDSYKKQIETLGASDGKLMSILLEKSIDAITHNASQTLDGKHGDKMPAHEAVEKIVNQLSDVKSAISKIATGA